MQTGLSANQLWKQQKKEGLTTLDFKPWLDREKAKGWKNLSGDMVAPASGMNSGIQDVINQLHAEGGLQTTAGSTYLFGINKKVLIWTGVAAGALLIGIIVYKKMKK